MTRKDNDLIPLWNTGFSKLQSSGKFKQLCDEANEKHGNILGSHEVESFFSKFW